MSPEDRRREAAAPAVVEPAPGSVYDIFKEVFPDVEFTAIQGILDVILVVDRAEARRVLETAKSHPRLAFDFLRNLSGVDYEAEGMEVVYHLFSYQHRHNVTIRVKLPPDDLRIPTASHIWRAADWHEREARDMFGIVFEGHPNLVPILLPEDMLDHHPLRKDNPLAPLEEWQGEALGPDMGQAGYIPPGSGFEVEAATESEE
jgi:NADH:ubiquinone oxidoreductase subunit C